MTYIIVIISIIGVLNILLTIANLFFLKEILTIRMVLSQLQNASVLIANRTVQQEMFLKKINEGFVQFVNTSSILLDKFEFLSSISDISKMKKIYKTPDGRYSAASIQELIEKIQADGNEEQYLSEEDVDNLRKLFEKENLDDDDVSEEF